jgi:hypothetical protein
MTPPPFTLQYCAERNTSRLQRCWRTCILACVSHSLSCSSCASPSPAGAADTGEGSRGLVDSSMVLCWSACTSLSPLSRLKSCSTNARAQSQQMQACTWSLAPTTQHVTSLPLCYTYVKYGCCFPPRGLLGPMAYLHCCWSSARW